MVSNSEPKSCGEGQLPVLARQGIIPVRAASSAQAATQLHARRYFNRDAKAKNAKFLVIFSPPPLVFLYLMRKPRSLASLLHASMPDKVL